MTEETLVLRAHASSLPFTTTKHVSDHPFIKCQAQAVPNAITLYSNIPEYTELHADYLKSTFFTRSKHECINNIKPQCINNIKTITWPP